MNIKDVQNNKIYKVVYNKHQRAIFYNQIVNNVVYEVQYIYNGNVIINKNLRIVYSSINAWIEQVNDGIIKELTEISEEQLKADMVLELL